jgi:thiol:disulfide interchange protein DsbD
MALGLSTGKAAAGENPPERQAIHVTPTLICETESLVPGETAWLGVDLKIEKGWHIYWPGVNDTGTPPTLQVTAPDGFKVGETQWPAPHRSLTAGPDGGILDHVYESGVMLLIPIEVPKDAKSTSAAFSIKCGWVVCSQVCLNEGATVTLTLPMVAPGTKAKASADAPKFAATRLRIPNPLKKGIGPTAQVEHRTLVVEYKDATKLSFYPLEDSAPMPHLAKEGESTKGKLTIEIKPDSPKAHVKGVIEVQSKDSKQPAFYSVDLEVPQEPK